MNHTIKILESSDFEVIYALLKPKKKKKLTLKKLKQ